MYLKDGEGGVHFSQKTMLVHLATNSDNDDDEEGDEDDAPSINWQLTVYQVRRQVLCVHSVFSPSTYAMR